MNHIKLREDAMPLGWHSVHINTLNDAFKDCLER